MLGNGARARAMSVRRRTASLLGVSGTALRGRLQGWRWPTTLADAADGRTCNPPAYLRDLFISLANGHLAKDIGALMPWAYAVHINASQ